jgi:DNA polymerase
MAKESPLPETDWLRQARQHLESLRLAGVEWLPTARVEVSAAAVPLSASPSAETAASAPPVAASSLLPGWDEGSPSETTGPALAPAAPQEERRRALTVLAETVSTCTRCPELAATRTQTVFGVGPVDADLCFVGEAPGADEDAQGEPFVGAAGQLLNKIIAACRMKREEVYICNIIRCRPPGNRTPLPNEVANCREWLEKTFDLVRPKFICALGGTAASNLLGTTQPMSKLRGRFHDYRGIPVLCTYHSAYLLPHRSPGKKKDVWEDMKLLMARMGRPVG